MAHRKHCLARAVISAVENARDDYLVSREDFRHYVDGEGFNTLVDTALGYLSDGLSDCICDDRPNPDFIATVTTREPYSAGYKVLQVEIRQPGNLETITQIHEIRPGLLPDHVIARTVGIVTGLHGQETDRIYVDEVNGSTRRVRSMEPEFYEVFIAPSTEHKRIATVEVGKPGKLTWEWSI